MTGNSLQQIGLTITKSQLKNILGCTTWSRFYNQFMTVEVIEGELGLTRAEYARIREFSVAQTRKLKQYFELVSE